MNRHERRAAASAMNRGAVRRPEQMTQVPRERWPELREPQSTSVRVDVWWSREYLAQIFVEAAVTIGTESFAVMRISVTRTRLEANGRFEAGIPWDDLQRIKAECGFADRYGMEIFPPAIDVVNVANMRHLWLLERPLPIGWTRY